MDLLTVKELAEIIDLKPNSIIQTIKRNPDFPFLRLSKKSKYLFILEDVLAYMGRKSPPCMNPEVCIDSDAAAHQGPRQQKRVTHHDQKEGPLQDQGAIHARGRSPETKGCLDRSNGQTSRPHSNPASGDKPNDHYSKKGRNTKIPTGKDNSPTSPANLDLRSILVELDSIKRRQH